MGFCDIICKVMKEILIKLFEKYALFRGNGKLAVLFVAALICLIFINKKQRGRVHPLLFVVSVFTGISVAFTNLIEKVFTDSDEKKGLRMFYGVISVLFIFFAITLSGSRIWSTDFIDSRESIEAYSDNVEDVAIYLCNYSDSPKVLADEKLMAMLLSYSSELEPMYPLVGSLGKSKLTEDEKKLIDAISDRHPPMDTITRLANQEGRFFVVVDRTETWPEKAVEGNYTMIDTVGNIDIYEYGGPVNE